MKFSWERNLVVLWIGVFFAYGLSYCHFISTDLLEHGAWRRESFGNAGPALPLVLRLASALISPYWGSLADKYGRKPMLIRSGFSLAALYLINYFVHDPYVSGCPHIPGASGRLRSGGDRSCGDEHARG